MKIEAALRKAETQVMSLPNVIGVGIGERDGKPVIKVFVSRKVDKALLQPNEIIPAKIGGHATDVEVMGTVTAQAKPNPA